MRNLKRAAAAALALAISFPAFTHPGHNVDAIEFSNAYARAMPPAAQTGGGFVTITNDGSIDDVLLMITSPAATKVDLHQTVMENDMMKMGPVEGGLAIPAGGTLVFEPGGIHMMFMQVETPFAEGDAVPVTLHFEHAGPVDLVLPVGPIGATSAPMDHMNH